MPNQEPESKFGQTVVAIGFEDAVRIVRSEVPASLNIDPNVVGEIIASALAIGGYIGSELAVEQIMPPPEERASFNLNFVDARVRLDAVIEHTQTNVIDRLATTEPPIQ